MILYCSWNYLSSGRRRATAQGKLLHLRANNSKCNSSKLCGELKIKKEQISVIYGWTAAGGHQIVSSLKAERKDIDK